MQIDLLPFPGEALQLAWGWLNEFHRWNFDDYGPKNFDEFAQEMANRVSSVTEYLWAVGHEGELVGMVGVSRPAERLAALHGICFTKRVHGSGVAKAAVEMVMAGLEADGVERIEAYYFAENMRIRSFLKKVGFCDEGIMKARTMCGGKPTDVRIVAKLVPVRVKDEVAQAVN